MSVYSNKYIPAIYNHIDTSVNSTGLYFRTLTEEGEIKFQNGRWSFNIGEDEALSFDVNGITSVLPDQTGHSGEYLTTDGTTASWAAGSGGVTDHGALTGLTDDDHSQYFNTTRANTWFGTKSVASLSNHSHTVLTDIGTNTHVQIDSHISNISNPHSVTKAQVNLGNVENTALSTWAGSSNITTVGTLSSGSADSIVDIDNILPSQSGNSGKVLTTDGSNSSWGDFSIFTYRRGSEGVVSGSYNILFDTAIGGSPTQIFIRCYDSSGNNVDYTIDSRSTNGFSGDVGFDATIEYLAIL